MQAKLIPWFSVSGFRLSNDNQFVLLHQRLLKHTDVSHPDHALLLEAQKEVHELAVKINCTERESLEYEQQQATLKELENIIEGSINIVSAERVFVRHDTVTMVSGQGTRKERALFLFSDLLVITSVKRRSGTIRKPSAWVELGYRDNWIT